MTAASDGAATQAKAEHPRRFLRECLANAIQASATGSACPLIVVSSRRHSVCQHLRRSGHAALSFNQPRADAFDVSRNSVRNVLVGWIRSRCVGALLIECPTQDQLFFVAIAALVFKCMRAGIPCVVESLAQSQVFQHPPLCRLFEQGGRSRTSHMCQYGGRMRHRRQAWPWLMPWHVEPGKMCRGYELCSHTGRRHPCSSHIEWVSGQTWQNISSRFPNQYRAILSGWLVAGWRLSLRKSSSHLIKGLRPSQLWA